MSKSQTPLQAAGIAAALLQRVAKVDPKPSAAVIVWGAYFGPIGTAIGGLWGGCIGGSIDGPCARLE